MESTKHRNEQEQTVAVNKVLHILIIDDSEDDALLIMLALRKGGLRPEYLQVEGEEALRNALTQHDWDVVISDHNMPGLTSQDTITIVKEIDPDMPVIVVSGTIEEQVGV